jgi:hypothetical protein
MRKSISMVYTARQNALKLCCIAFCALEAPCSTAPSIIKFTTTKLIINHAGPVRSRGEAPAGASAPAVGISTVKSAPAMSNQCTLRFQSALRIRTLTALVLSRVTKSAVMRRRMRDGPRMRRHAIVTAHVCAVTHTTYTPSRISALTQSLLKEVRNGGEAWILVCSDLTRNPLNIIAPRCLRLLPSRLRHFLMRLTEGHFRSFNFGIRKCRDGKPFPYHKYYRIFRLNFLQKKRFKFFLTFFF